MTMQDPEVKWLLQEGNHDDDRPATARLMAEVERQGMKAVRIKDCAQLITDPYKDFGPEDCVVVHGDLGTVRATERLPWLPGAWCNKQEFRCSSYYPKLGDLLLNWRAEWVPWGILKQRPDERFQYQHDRCWYSAFLRPDSGLKPFEGGVYSGKEFAELVQEHQDLPDDTLVLVAMPVKLISEWRVVCAGDQLLTACRYRVDGKNLISGELLPVEARRLVEQAAARFQPDPLYVLDVGELRDSGIGASYWRIIEANSFSAAGLYDCNPEPIVRAAKAAAIKEWRASRE
jgi:hypothetical protein